MAKTYTVSCARYRTGSDRVSSTTGTIAELVEYYGYTLEKGASWQHEKGNKKINRNPKTLASLLTNLNNAVNNAAANGYAGEHYTGS